MSQGVEAVTSRCKQSHRRRRLHHGRPSSQMPSRTVVVPAPAATPVGVQQTLYGTIDDVDGNGKVKIKTERDSFEARVAPDALRQIRKGDNVVIDLTIVPPGSPAASPR